MANAGRYQIIRGYDKKRKMQMYVVVVIGLHLNEKDMDHLKATCQDRRGWWSQGWDWQARGFAFRSIEAARRWAVDYIEALPMDAFD